MDELLVVVASLDDALVAKVRQARFRVVSARTWQSDGGARIESGVLLLDTATVAHEELRSLRARADISHFVSVAVVDDEANLHEERSAVEADDAELRTLDVGVLARRIRAWGSLSLERRGAALLRRALDVSVNGVCIADARVRGFPLTYVSRTFERMTGYSRDECLGRQCSFLQGPDTDPDAIATVREALALGKRATVVLGNYRKDGSLFWNELTIVPIHDESGEVESVLGVQHDVSSLVAARILHRDSEERADFMAALLDGVEALLTTNEEGRILFANLAAEELLGVPVDMLLGANAVDALELPERAASALRGESRAPLDVRYETVTGNGSPLAVHLVMRRGAAEGVGWILTLRDAVKDAALDSERELARRLVTLGSALAGLTHEIRNPLATMSLLLADLADGRLSAADASPRLKRQLDRVTRIVRDSAVLARTSPPHRVTLDARHVAREAADVVRSTSAERGISVTLDLGEDPLLVAVDERQMVQVLGAILTNALEAARLRVVLRVAAVGDRVVISVADDGAGILPQHRGRIFDPFYTTKASGTGLGLAIAQRLVEAHGGTLRLEESETDGTTFALALAREVER